MFTVPLFAACIMPCAHLWNVQAGFQSLAAYKEQLLCGELTLQPRLSDAPVRMPLPAPPTNGTIYQIQTRLKNPDFVRSPVAPPPVAGAAAPVQTSGSAVTSASSDSGGKAMESRALPTAIAAADPTARAPMLPVSRPATAHPDWWG